LDALRDQIAVSHGAELTIGVALGVAGGLAESIESIRGKCAVLSCNRSWYSVAKTETFE
jgi:hypothetical protein